MNIQISSKIWIILNRERKIRICNNSASQGSSKQYSEIDTKRDINSQPNAIASFVIIARFESTIRLFFTRGKKQKFRDFRFAVVVWRSCQALWSTKQEKNWNDRRPERIIFIDFVDVWLLTSPTHHFSSCFPSPIFPRPLPIATLYPAIVSSLSYYFWHVYL